MIALKVSKNEALIALEHFPHQRFRNGIRRYWKVDADGAVDGRSVCWLYCWAKTGMGVRTQARKLSERFMRFSTFRSIDSSRRSTTSGRGKPGTPGIADRSMLSSRGCSAEP